MTADNPTTPGHDATRQDGWRDDFVRAAHAPGPALTAIGEAREERRAKVLKLHLAGVPIRRLATTLGVSKDTIEKDLAAARRAVIGGLQPSRIHEVVADCMAAYLHVREMALHDATVARPGTLERGKALDNALRANIAVVRFCQDMRLMPKAPIDLALAIKDHPALKALAPEELPRFFKGVTRTLIALGEPSAVDQVRALAAALNGGEEVEGEGAEEGGA